MVEPTEIEALREEYEKQIFDLRQLLAVSKSLNSMLEYHHLIDAILFNVMGQMKVLKAGLFAKKGLDARRFSLHRDSKGFDIDRSVDYSIPEEHPIVKLFTRQYGCYTLDDIKSRIGSFAGIEGLAALEPSLLVPLKAKGSVNGLLIVADKIGGGEFDVYEREYALNLGGLAAIAINNVALFELTTTDAMTRLRMKHYFYSMLVERMGEAASTGGKLSVMMIDIDFFKRFNDEYGHSCGDHVLKRVAREIQANVRSMDLASRYGGEEFCVLLPETDLERARAVAERVRVGIESAVTEYEGRSLSVTASLGVAEYDRRRDASAKALLDRADRAMYDSKQAGRNRVTLAD
jgi:diguanylate cyclase (GGDEF) domain